MNMCGSKGEQKNGVVVFSSYLRCLSLCWWQASA